MNEHSAENDADVVERIADALRKSRLSWGVHADRWGDVEWQRKFWTEAAEIALREARVIPPAESALCVADNACPGPRCSGCAGCPIPPGEQS